MLASFRNLIKFCRFSNTGDDDKQYPVQQVEYLGKPVDAFIVMPYGSHANIPEDFLGVAMQIAGQEQNRIVIPTSAKERINPVESGEVVYFHPVTKSKIHFKNNGDIDIETEADVNIQCKNLNATCTSASVTASSKIDAIAPIINLTGDVTISGTLAVGGASTLAGVTSNGKDIGDTHKHTQGNDSASDIQAMINGVV